MPYLSICFRRQWDERGARWVCGLDVLDCSPAVPAAFKDCPRFAPARGVCPVCLSLGRASQLAVDTEAWAGGSGAPRWACPACSWDGGPAEMLDGLEWACLDMLDDVRFWRAHPGRLAADLPAAQGDAARGR